MLNFDSLKIEKFTSIGMSIVFVCCQIIDLLPHNERVKESASQVWVFFSNLFFAPLITVM